MPSSARPDRLLRSTTPGARALFVLLVGIAIASTVCESDDSPETSLLRGQAMGTSWEVTLPRFRHASELPALRQEIVATLEQVEVEMSHWRDDSVVSRFNRSESTGRFEVTEGIAAVIEEAKRTHELSGGAFDVTAAPLVNLWGFGPQGRHDRPPTTEQIEAALRHVGSSQLHLIAHENGQYFLRKQSAELQVDLSALAKGYAIDLIAETLDARRVDSFLIELGGELLARGTSPQDTPWQIGLEQPEPQSVGNVRRTIRLSDESIATSGGYRNFIPDAGTAGTRIHHIIDPRTGRPVDHDLISVSVKASSAMRADAWATALMVLGPHEGFELATELELAATFVSHTPTGVVERSTERFGSSKPGSPTSGEPGR